MILETNCIYILAGGVDGGPEGDVEEAAERRREVVGVLGRVRGACKHARTHTHTQHTT